MKWCHTCHDIPKTPHFAIIEQRSISIPGDERSRTHPGHGYPASTEQVWDYIVFPDRASWEAEIKSREAKVFKTEYVAIAATPAVITSTVHVHVEVK
jgi:hypothetical protein